MRTFISILLTAFICVSSTTVSAEQSRGRDILKRYCQDPAKTLSQLKNKVLTNAIGRKSVEEVLSTVKSEVYLKLTAIEQLEAFRLRMALAKAEFEILEMEMMLLHCFFVEPGK